MEATWKIVLGVLCWSQWKRRSSCPSFCPNSIQVTIQMKREGKEETVSNLITWLHQEASIRFRGKANTYTVERNEIRRRSGLKKTENNPANSEDSHDKTCPLGCKTKHHLAAYPKFQILTVNQRWEIVKQHWWCRKCLRAHHTNDCKKPDGSTCDKCRKKHHRCLHNEKTGKTNTIWIPKYHRFKVSSKDPHLRRMLTSRGMLCTRKAS